MRKIKIEMFEASDGTQWKTEDECRGHEAVLEPEEVRFANVLKKATPILVRQAMDYKEGAVAARDFADVIEFLGKICADSRIAGGGARRKTKPKDKPDGAPAVDQGVPAEPADSGQVEAPSPKSSPVDTTGFRAIHERAAAQGDTPKYPTSENRFPAHTKAAE